LHSSLSGIHLKHGYNNQLLGGAWWSNLFIRNGDDLVWTIIRASVDENHGGRAYVERGDVCNAKANDADVYRSDTSRARNKLCALWFRTALWYGGCYGILGLAWVYDADGGRCDVGHEEGDGDEKVSHYSWVPACYTPCARLGVYNVVLSVF
jgi:hypothetical protein